MMTGARLAYSIDWYITNRVLLITVLSEMNRDDLVAMEAEAFKYIRQASCTIHAIVDLQGLTAKPRSIQEALRDTERPKHKNQGTSVIIVAPMNPLVKFICSAVMTTLRLNYDICDSFDEAKDKIAKLEAKRPHAGVG
jgi:hypothetical protein